MSSDDKKQRKEKHLATAAQRLAALSTSPIKTNLPTKHFVVARQNFVAQYLGDSSDDESLDADVQELQKILSSSFYDDSMVENDESLEVLSWQMKIVRRAAAAQRAANAASASSQTQTMQADSDSEENPEPEGFWASSSNNKSGKQV